MFDIKTIRERPDDFDAGLARRGLSPRAAGIIALDRQAREYTQTLNGLQSRRNALSKQIGAARASADTVLFERLRLEVEEIKQEMPRLEAARKEKSTAVTDILASIPNIPDPCVPDGEDEESNVVVRTRGTPRQDDTVAGHADSGIAGGLMDFVTAAKMSGSRFVLLKGELARLERALSNYMLDLHTSRFGYVEHVPPLLVHDHALYGTGQLPKFSGDQFVTTAGLTLIPTAEVSLTNTVRESVLDARTLPLRLTACTPCFRSEAGAAGRDTHGMIRMHQFSKVELVSITLPDRSRQEHERMTECAQTVLTELDIPFRTVLLCAGDTGFSARKTYDIEAWLPGERRYREISSCSDCGDFQARRMNARFRYPDDKKPRFVHTLNGSGLAVGRTLVAIMENYQNPDGSVSVPGVLHSYMGGCTRIEAVS